MIEDNFGSGSGFSDGFGIGKGAFVGVILFIVVVSAIIFGYFSWDESGFNNYSVVPEITTISSYDNSGK